MLFHLDFTGLNFNRVNFTKHRSESRGQFLLSRAFDSLHLTRPWKLLKTCNCEIKVQRLWKTLKKRNAEKSQHQSLCDLHCQVSEQKCPTAANVLKCLRRQIFENFNRGKHFGCQVWLDFLLACSPLGHFAPYSIAHLSGSAWQCLAQDSHMLHAATCCYTAHGESAIKPQTALMASMTSMTSMTSWSWLQTWALCASLCHVAGEATHFGSNSAKIRPPSPSLWLLL